MKRKEHEDESRKETHIKSIRDRPSYSLSMREKIPIDENRHGRECLSGNRKADPGSHSLSLSGRWLRLSAYTRRRKGVFSAPRSRNRFPLNRTACRNRAPIRSYREATSTYNRVRRRPSRAPHVCSG